MPTTSDPAARRPAQPLPASLRNPSGLSQRLVAPAAAERRTADASDTGAERREEGSPQKVLEAEAPFPHAHDERTAAAGAFGMLMRTAAVIA